MTAASSNQSQQLQLERLQSSLNRAYAKVPFHRERMDQAGFDPAMLRNVSDIQALPLMTRDDFCDHYPYGLFAVPLRDIVRIHSASGTGDNPTISGYTRQDLSMWQQLVANSLTSCSVSDADILQLHMAPGLGNWARDYQAGAEALGASVIPHVPLSVDKKLMVLRDYKTSVLITTPSAVHHLISHMNEVGITPVALSLRTLILVGHPPCKEDINLFERQLGVRVWSHYGLTEVPGPAIANSCKEQDGFHIDDALFFPEVIDPVTGTVLPLGEEGELVLTGLKTRAFPMIRFRTGDRVRLYSEPCSCGGSGSRIQWDGRRTDSLLSVGGVKVSPSQVTALIESALGFLPETCRMTADDTQERAALIIQMTMEDRLFSDEIKHLELQMEALCLKIESHLGVPTSIILSEKALSGD